MEGLMEKQAIISNEGYDDFMVVLDESDEIVKAIFKAETESFDSNFFVSNDFNYVYSIKGTKDIIFSKNKPQSDEQYSYYVDLTFLKKAYTFIEYRDFIELQNIQPKIVLAKKLIAEKATMPYAFATRLDINEKIDDVCKYGDFRFFGNEILANTNFLSTFSKFSQYRFYNFAYSLGCFSKEKYVGAKNITLGQKTCSFLAKVVNNYPHLNSWSFCDDLTSCQPSQEFFNFISVAVKRSFPNFENLFELNKINPGIFSNVMTNFNEISDLKDYVGDDGKIIHRTWNELFVEFHNGRLKVYEGVTPKNKDIADIFSKRGISQSNFERACSMREFAEKNNIQRHILGKPLIEHQTTENNFTFEMLDKSDARNFVIGLYCSCCSHISSLEFGEIIARNTVVKNDIQNLVVKNNKGIIIGKATIYLDRFYSIAIINEFDINYKYREHEKSNGIYSVAPNSQDEKNRDEIFNTFMRGIYAFIKEYDLQNPDTPLQKVIVGMGNNRLKRQCHRYREPQFRFEVPEELYFLDAMSQRLLFDRHQEVLLKADEIKKDDTIDMTF